MNKKTREKLGKDYYNLLEEMKIDNMNIHNIVDLMKTQKKHNNMLNDLMEKYNINIDDVKISKEMDEN